MDSSAWWDTGHKMVCDEAYKLLTPSAVKAVDLLIEEHGSFGRACLWADWIKGERKDTRSWHYINLPDAEQNTYNAKCPENGCIFDSFYNTPKHIRQIAPVHEIIIFPTLILSFL